MASRHRWRPRRRSWQFYDDASTVPWLRRAVRGGGDGYLVCIDLREKLAVERKEREEQEQRRQARAPDIQVSYNRPVRDYRQPRGPERIVPVTRERAYNIMVNEENKKNGAAECENSSQIESDQVQRGTFGRNWNIAAVPGRGRTTWRYRPLQKHHEHELDESNPKATAAQSFSSSEKQHRESDQVQRGTFGRNWNIAAVPGRGRTTGRYRPLQKHHEHELDESNLNTTRAQSFSSSEKQQIESDEVQRGTFGRNWNIAAVPGQRKTGRYRPLQKHHEHELNESNPKATAAQSFSSSEKQTPRTDSPVAKRKHPHGCCQGNPKYAERNSGDGNDFYQLNIGKSSMASKTWNNDRIAESYWPTPANCAPADPASDIGPWAPKRPRLDTTVRGLKEKELKRQQDVTSPKDKNGYILRWLQWGTGRSHAQEMSFFRRNGKRSPSPRRSILASECCNNQRRSSEEISAYAESDSSECKAERQKLQNSSAEKEPLRVWEMDDLLESFKKMCRPT